jgi:ribosomal protein S17E
MQQDDLQTLVSIKDALASNTGRVEAALIHNPSKEVENSLAGFLKHRLGKLQEATDFEDQVKDALLARISEANFSQLIGLLEVVQKNNNIATEKILAPFISQSGKTVTETLREGAHEKETAASQIYEETNDKKVLQSLAALSQLMEIAAKAAQSSSHE